MKNVFVFLVLLFTTMVCSAQVSLEQSKQTGKYRAEVKSPEEWEKPGIVAEEYAMKYIKYFPQATSNPDSFLLVYKWKETIKMVGPFKALKMHVEEGILFNSEKNKIFFIEKKELREERSFLFIFSILSVIFMIISSILFSINKKRATDFVAIAAYVAIVAAFIAFVSGALQSGLLLFLAVVFAASSLTEKFKNYVISVILYYILMVLCFIYLF